MLPTIHAATAAASDWRFRALLYDSRSPGFSSIIRTSAACYDADVTILAGMLFVYGLQDVYGLVERFDIEQFFDFSAK